MEDSTKTAYAVCRAAAIAAALLIASASVALCALHLLRPELAPANNFVSNYAVGPHGWLMSSFFLSFGAALLALALGLWASGLRGAAAYVGLAALVVAAAGLVVTTIFPTDLPGAPPTRSGDIHEMSFRVNVAAILVAVLALSAALRAKPAWRPYRRSLWALAILVVLGLVVQFATLRKGLPYGIANRVFVALVFAWLFTVADRLRRLADARKA